MHSKNGALLLWFSIHMTFCSRRVRAKSKSLCLISYWNYFIAVRRYEEGNHLYHYTCIMNSHTFYFHGKELSWHKFNFYDFLRQLFTDPSANITLKVRIQHSFSQPYWYSPWWRVLVIRHMDRVKRICVFEHSVMTNFNCACPVIQRGQGSGFLSEGSSWLTACMSEQRRFWRDCADAQARLNLRCSHRR